MTASPVSGIAIGVAEAAMARARMVKKFIILTVFGVRELGNFLMKKKMVEKRIVGSLGGIVSE